MFEDLRKMRISGWRGKAQRRDKGKSVLREVKDRSAIGYRYSVVCSRYTSMVTQVMFKNALES
jgi:hypothetical protein